LARVLALIAGTNKHFPNGQFTLGSTVYTTATLLPVLQGLADAIAAVNTAHAGVKDAIAALAGMTAKAGPTVSAYHRFVLAAFSNATQTLADFGIAAPKPRAPRTSEQNAAAAAKAKATRAARGTASKKQKAAVKGAVTGVAITPVTGPAPAEPAAPAAPAKPASSTATAPTTGTPQ
jgi:hypothetical protein